VGISDCKSDAGTWQPLVWDGAARTDVAKMAVAVARTEENIVDKEGMVKIQRSED
jgi:hypothetical protein